MRQKLRTRNTAIAPVKSSRNRIGVTITPLKGFFLTLLCFGAPTVSLGTVCLSLLQNNSQLNEKNQQLSEIASEVKAEVDSLGEEIEDLREWAGTESNIPLPESVDTTSDSTVETTSSAKNKTRLSGSNADQMVKEDLPPKGGPSRAVDSLELLEDVRQQVPTLSQTLVSQVKPAVEEAIAKEAAYPSSLPVVGKIRISSEYGVRRNPFGGGGYEVHEGMDFVGETGNIIAATGDGVVTLAGNKGGYGIAVTIDHQNGYESLYAHMSEVKVKVGESVNRGQIIGYIGSTGRSSGPHLHYGLYKDGEAVNPRQFFKLVD